MERFKRLFRALDIHGINNCWAANDNEKNFQIIQKEMEKSNKEWIYTTKKISYHSNEQGFREKPFSEVDWQNSIVVFGCSHIEGVGVAEEDTLPRQIESITGIPVVNLGISGSAVDLACWNSRILHDNFPHPRAIVQVWTGLGRYSRPIKKGQLYDDGHPWENNYPIHLNWPVRMIDYIKTDRAMWRGKTCYIEGTYFEKDSTIHDDHVLRLHMVDKARDDLHPGIESHRQAARKIVNKLSEQGFLIKVTFCYIKVAIPV